MQWKNVLHYSYHALKDRLKLDRRRLEAGHLLFAVINLIEWYPEDFKQTKLEMEQLGRLTLDVPPTYQSVFCRQYTST